MRRLKGKEVRVKLDGTEIAKSTSCEFNLTANTIDAASKDDSDGDFDNPEVTNVTWDASNESFATNRAGIVALLRAWISRKLVNVSVIVGDQEQTVGTAYITGLSLQAPKDGYATVNITLTGNGPFSLYVQSDNVDGE